MIKLGLSYDPGQYEFLDADGGRLATVKTDDGPPTVSWPGTFNATPEQAIQQAHAMIMAAEAARAHEGRSDVLLDSE